MEPDSSNLEYFLAFSEETESHRASKVYAKPGDYIGRFRITAYLSEGSYGQVYEAIDTLGSTRVALKLLPGKSKGEVAVLKELNALDTQCSHFVKLISDFEWGDYHCLVFEYLSKTLLELIQETYGLTLLQVKGFAWQILTALSIMRTAGITHCDLKPENIMMTSPDKAGIKIVDFGSSTKGDTFRHLPSRFYRPPEAVLGLKCTHSIDMWSVGCILVELYTGRPLFPSNDENELMDRIRQIKGTHPLDSEEFERTESEPQSLEEWVHMHCVWTDDSFLDLVEKMIDYDPQRRITPVEALRHPFFEGTPSRFGSPWSSTSVSTMDGSLDRINSCEFGKRSCSGTYST